VPSLGLFMVYNRGREPVTHKHWIALIGVPSGLEGRVSKWKTWIFGGLHRKQKGGPAYCTKGRAAEKGNPLARPFPQPSLMCSPLARPVVQHASRPFCAASTGGTEFGVPESTPEGFCIFLSDPESKIWENRTWTRSHFSISAVARVCVVIS